MFHLENAYDPDRVQNQFPSGRDIHKTGSGLYWNLIGSMYGAEPQHHEPIDPHLERMRDNQVHYMGFLPPPRRRVALSPGRAVTKSKPKGTKSRATQLMDKLFSKNPQDLKDIVAATIKAGHPGSLMGAAEGQVNSIPDAGDQKLRGYFRSYERSHVGLQSGYR